jgi:outer membrane protein
MKTIKKFTFIATAVASFFILTQCNSSNAAQEAVAQATAETENSPKIVYVNLDSLMNKYNLAKDINKEMMRKEENIKMTLSKKADEMKKEQADFEYKYKNNVFSTPERAQEEYNRLAKKQQDILQLEQRLTMEFEQEGLEKNKALRDSIANFIKEYNSTKGYDYILTKLGDNLLYANETLDITQEIVDGLNSKYTSPE